MIINNNIPALNTHRQMGINQNAMQNSMEKLSSGLRINRAGDDAAGLAISEKMRAQINGLDQASRNAQDGISMIQTAEGALGETHDILQRMRELAVQSANDTNVDIDREEIQKEINALTSEINRIGNTTEFNTQNVLRGESPGLELGEDATQAIEDAGLDNFSIAETSALAAGDYNLEIADGVEIDGELSGDGPVQAVELASGFSAANEGNYQIQTTFSAQLPTDGNLTNLSNVAITNSANNVPAVAGEYVVSISSFAEGDPSNAGTADYTVTLNGEIVDSGTIANSSDGTGPISGSITLTNGVSFDIGGITANASSFETFTIGEEFSAQLGTLSANGSFATVGSAVVITASQTSVNLGSAGQSVVANFGSTLTVDNNDFSVAAGQVATITDSDGETVASQVLTEGTNNEINDSGLSFDAGATITNTATGGIDFEVTGGDFTSTFQIGANEGQSITINVGDMRAEALGISGREEGGDAEGVGENIGSAVFTETAEVNNGTTNEGIEYSLDVSSYENATAAVEVLNQAIEKVSGQRSDLGAFQNRLEHTISNLDNSSENLSAAESRIRDVDMAAEMMEMTRANILSQASQSMLAQANQQPQSVLQLLG